MNVIYASIQELAPTANDPFRFSVYISRGFAARKYTVSWQRAVQVAECLRDMEFKCTRIERKDMRIYAEYRE